jgi:hypothetical protein
MKMLSWIFVAFITLAVSACQTTQTESMNVAPGKNLVGDWTGTWTSDKGASGGFALKVIRVSKGGQIIARRSSAIENNGAVAHVSMGKVMGGQIELDRGKGKHSWFKLSLQKAGDGQLWLKGSYSAVVSHKDKAVHMGKIALMKAGK